MDAYDYEQIDKAMSARIDAIYHDPTRHAFYSDHQFCIDEDLTGPRGGKVRGKKRICAHCGNKRRGHAEVTEQLRKGKS